MEKCCVCDEEVGVRSVCQDCKKGACHDHFVKDSCTSCIEINKWIADTLAKEASEKAKQRELSLDEVERKVAA